tara:strand:+ start:20488 stop:22149 length:1662 start_codon:yes stop_codon:yes gene_type:complete
MVGIAGERAPLMREMGERPVANVRRAILVAGMHRSGTSAVTRVLSIIGCSLPGDLVPASKGDNERGFWESREVVNLNNEMLESVGSYWDDWNFIREEWFGSAVAQEFAARAADVVKAEFGDAPLIVLKDPRICRLLPVWLKAVELAGYSPSVVMPLRNPLEVAESLMKRSQIDLTLGHLMWLRHVLDAERYSRDCPRTFVRYETLMNDWRSWIAKVERDLVIGFPRVSPIAEEEIGEFIKPDLWRNRAPDTLLRDNGIAPAWARDAYFTLHRWSTGKHAQKDEMLLDRIRAELQTVTPVFVRPLYAFRKTGKAYRTLAKEKEVLTKEKEVLTKEKEVLTEENDVLAKEKEVLKKDLSEKAAAIDALGESLKKLEKQSEADRAGWGEVEKALKASLEEALTLTEELRSALAAQAADASKANALVADLSKQVDSETRRRKSNEEARFHESATLTRLLSQRAGENAMLKDMILGLIKSVSPVELEPRLRVLLRPKRRKMEDLRRHGQMLSSIGGFDADWYLHNNPDVAASGLDPAEHFVAFGVFEGRLPHPLFDQE